MLLLTVAIKFLMYTNLSNLMRLLSCLLHFGLDCLVQLNEITYQISLSACLMHNLICKRIWKVDFP